MAVPAAVAVVEAEEAGKMKTRSKIGNKKGNPAYRTPSVFRYQKDLTIARNKSKISQLPYSNFKKTNGGEDNQKQAAFPAEKQI